jgi:dienelactone hydrolase
MGEAQRNPSFDSCAPMRLMGCATLHPSYVLLWLAAAFFVAAPLPAPAQNAAPSLPWSVDTIVTRTPAEGEPVTTTIAVRTPVSPPVRHVVLYPSPNGRPFLKMTSGNTELDLIGPWVRASDSLNDRGIAVVFADAPSDAWGRSIEVRASAEVREDLQAIVAHLGKMFAGIPIHLGLFGSATLPALDVASRINGIKRIAVASGDLRNARTSGWRGLKPPVMLIHAPSATCGATPFLEAQWFARNNGFTLVKAGYEQPAAQFDCGDGSQHVLSRLETEFAETVLHWFDGTEVPKHIGHPNPPTAWREQAVTYPAPGIFGVNQLEMTLLFPQGAGPFPLVVFNHGDVEMDAAVIRYRQRMREVIVAGEFLQHGIAVAIPARRGVGLSEGSYPGGFAQFDGDPTYKARVHAQDILPALAYLKARPEFDARRIVLAGHSAGGFSVMYIASTRPSGVIGVVSFSGGRTDANGWDGAGTLNKMMVSGFAQLGRTTRIPALWVFAENDSRYSVQTIRASHAAYVKAGGVARLSLSAPIAGDGHFIYHRPELWREALQGFLREHGVLNERGSAAATTQQKPAATE